METLFLKNGSNKKNKCKKTRYLFLLNTDICFVPNAFQHYFNEGRFME
ncbi:hypothetical protein SPPR111872_15555 [Sphingobacterium prati]